MYKRTVASLLWTAGCLAATAFLPVAGAAHPEIPAPTWDHVAPVMAEHCVTCHRSGGSASLALDTYEGARWAAAAIKRSVLNRSMPPWRAAPGFGEFANDASLGAAEVELIAAWADGGARKGEGEPRSIEPRRAGDLEPDLILRTVPHHIAGARQTIELAANNDDEHWIGGWRFIPGNAAAVLQADVSIASSGALGTWVPADGAVMLPDDVAYRLPPRATFVLDLRYRKISGEATDQSAIALYFARKPRHVAQHTELPCGTTRLSAAVRVLSIRPALDRFGDSVEVIARRPDGGVAPLGWFKNYPPNFHATYRYRHPVPLPEASVIDVRSRDASCRAQIEFVSN